MNDKSVKYQDGIHPIDKLTPESCEVIARALSLAISKFETWNLRVSEAGRLRMAEKWLNEVAEKGHFGDSEEKLVKTGKAAALAVDFYHISTALGDKEDESLASEITLALGGSLDSGDKDTTPFEFQSQFWIGTLLAQCGFKTTYLGGKRKGARPDYLIESNTFECAVEIKRPQTEASTARALGSAASQLHSFGKPGMIIIDHSGSLFSDDLIMPPPDVNVRERIGARLSRVHNSLHHEVESYTRSEKYSRVVLLVSLARFWSWKRTTELETDLGIHFVANAYPNACAGLVSEHSKRIQESLTHGIRHLTGNEPTITYRSV